MTDQPKPTPYFGKNWRVSSHGIFNGTMRIAKFDFDTDPSDEVKQAMYSEILALLCAPALQQRVDELERALDQEGAAIGMLKVLQAELTSDLRTAADQCESRSKNYTELCTMFQVSMSQTKSAQEDNQRLRELLRRIVEAANRDDFGSISLELLDEIDAIGERGSR